MGTNAIRQTTALAAVAVTSAALLAGCISAPVTATGSGVVTVAWSNTALAFDGATGDLLALCSENASTCDTASPDLLFTYNPAMFATEAILQVGTPVTDTSSTSVGLPAGRYTLQALNVSGGTPTAVGDLFSISIANAEGRPLWFQSTARDDDEADCPLDWSPSWAEWPYDGTGGFVCNRLMYADADDEQVPDEPSDQRNSWLQAIARGSSEDACPDGWAPSWAAWPNAGAGGPTCVRQG